MKTAKQSLKLFMLSVLAAASFSAQSTEGLLTADTYTVNIATKTLYNGKAADLSIGGTAKALVRFDLGTLPTGTTADNVLRATAIIWVNRVTKAGAIDVAPVTSSWNETTASSKVEPMVGSTLATVPVTASGYVMVDVSSAVKDWLTKPSNNLGLRIAAAGTSPLTAITIDSKENTMASRPSRLDITLTQSGPIGPQGPIGLTGAQGPQGPQGEKGDQGEKGETGADGPQGPIGPIGLTGAQGEKGVQGEKGDKGDTGAAGAKGDTGATGQQGIQGEPGPKGDTGAAGQQGAKGEKGDTGPAGPLSLETLVGKPCTPIGRETDSGTIALFTVKGDPSTSVGCAIKQNSRFIDLGEVVFDKTSGLMWEKKTEDGSIHDNKNHYYYSAKYTSGANGPLFQTFLSALNTKAAGSCTSRYLEGGNRGELVVSCESQTACFANHCDWRIPEIDELSTLVDCSQPGACINQEYLGPVPDLYGEYMRSANAEFWSATSTVISPDSAFQISFRDGVIGAWWKWLGGDDDPCCLARAVRGAR